MRDSVADLMKSILEEIGHSLDLHADGFKIQLEVSDRGPIVSRTRESWGSK